MAIYLFAAAEAREMTKSSPGRQLPVIQRPELGYGRAAGMRILVIEDEPRLRDFLSRGLAAEGYAVEEAADGETGLDRALAGPHALVILDLLLPGSDGLEVLRALHERRPELPVLILSARADLRSKLRGFQLGAHDYLAKPFAFDE